MTSLVPSAKERGHMTKRAMNIVTSYSKLSLSYKVAVIVFGHGQRTNQVVYIIVVTQVHRWPGIYGC